MPTLEKSTAQKADTSGPFEGEIVKHGTSKQSAESILKNGFDTKAFPDRYNRGSGISLTKTDKVANAWATDHAEGTVVLSRLSPDTKLISVQKFMDEMDSNPSLHKSFNATQEFFSKQGYDGIDYRAGRTTKSGKNIPSTEDEIRVWNTAKLKPIGTADELRQLKEQELDLDTAINDGRYENEAFAIDDLNTTRARIKELEGSSSPSIPKEKD